MPLLKKKQVEKLLIYNGCFWNKDLLAENLWTKKKTYGPEQRPSGLNQRPSNTTTPTLPTLPSPPHPHDL